MPRTVLIPKDIEAKLLANGRKSAELRGTAAEKDWNPVPVLKLFLPAGSATWLLTELDPEEPDYAFGLCDLGLGYPELGTVTLGELKELRCKAPFQSLGVERDRFFKATQGIREIASRSHAAGHIVYE